MYDCIVIGAGAAGLTAAITAARNGRKVLVLEQGDRAGRKIAASGNGKCNFTNEVINIAKYRTDDPAALECILCGDAYKRACSFLESVNLDIRTRNGYAYPASEQAASVVKALLLEAVTTGVEIQYGVRVTEASGNGKGFVVNGEIATASEKGDSRNVVHMNSGSDIKSSVVFTAKSKSLLIACGGKSCPKLGGSETGYAIARGFGHTVSEPRPALVKLNCAEKFCRTLSGVRCEARVSTLINGWDSAAEEGEIIFTDKGISGIPVMILSGNVSEALSEGRKVELSVDLMKNRTVNEVVRLLEKKFGTFTGRTNEEVLNGMLNSKLNYVLLKNSDIDPEAVNNGLGEAMCRKLAVSIKDLRLSVTSTAGFDDAQVTSGGVLLHEISAYTMQSSRVPGLFFAGEVINVDGICGGYNLTFAWLSGEIAGKNM